jgi:hypothetical protein
MSSKNMLLKLTGVALFVKMDFAPISICGRPSSKNPLQLGTQTFIAKGMAQVVALQKS